MSDPSDLFRQQSIGLSDGELVELQRHFVVDQSAAVELSQIESAAEQARRLMGASVLVPQWTSPGDSMGMRRLLGIDASLLDASSTAQRWLDNHSVARLVRDAQDLYSTLGLDRAAWDELLDPLARMRSLAGALEPLTLLLEQYVNPFEEEMARLERDFGDACRGVLVLQVDAWNAIDDGGAFEADAGIDEPSSDEHDDRVLDAIDSRSVTPPQAVPELVIASRFMAGLLLVMSRAARLAARFDPRAICDANASSELRVLDEPKRVTATVSEWVLVISAKQPEYAARLAQRVCCVLEGAWLWVAFVTQVTGELANEEREALTLADATSFDDAVRGLIVVLDEIERDLP